MKKTNIYTLVILVCMTFGFALTAKAQFSPSNEVYCYQYDYSETDGVKSRNAPHGEYYFAIFQNNWHYGIYRTFERYRQNPNECTFEGIYQNKREYEKQGAAYMVNRVYNASASTSSYYTYQCPSQKAWNGTWSDGRMYSFSKDRSVFIAWDSEAKTITRHYYKRIDINSLKPNLDFLE